MTSETTTAKIVTDETGRVHHVTITCPRCKAVNARGICGCHRASPEPKRGEGAVLVW